MANYFIYGYYGFGNFGDDLLLEVLITEIRARDPDAAFVIRARTVVPKFEHDPKIRFLLLESILVDQARSRFSRLRAYRAAMLDEVGRCDVFVIGGGTLFIDKGRLNWSLFFLHQAARAARRAGRKVVVIGVAIDILAHPVSLWLTRQIFSLADFSAVRDTLSLAYFQDWGTPPRLSADLAWLQPLSVGGGAPERRPVIGLNFIDYFRSSTQSLEGHEAYRSALLRLVERYRDRYDFLLIALQKGIGQRDDWFAEEYSALIPGGRVAYVNDAVSLRYALEEVDVIVTTRFHLALLAARAGIPTCVIDHELKLTSLAQDLALPSIPLSEFLRVDSEDPIERLKAWDAARTHVAAERIAERATVNFQWMP